MSSAAGSLIVMGNTVSIKSSLPGYGHIDLHHHRLWQETRNTGIYLEV
jgi:hypothetical protein